MQQSITPTSSSYELGDALDRLSEEPSDSAQFVHLDDAWARPHRNGAFGVDYPTHTYSSDDTHYDDVDSSLTVKALLEECLRVVAPGGAVVIDADDWLHSRVVPFLATRLGPAQYATGSVTELASNGHPDRSTPGMYLATGGYPVTIATPGSCPIQVETHQTAPRQRDNYGWGTAKPLAPYKTWLDMFTRPGDRVLVPCAGTAPTAIAAEHLDYALDVLAIDIEPGARDAYQRRRDAEHNAQTGLGAWS
jgi:hypothetical protein